MNALAVLLIVAGVIALGEGVTIGIQYRQKEKAEEQQREEVASLAEKHKAEVQDLQGRLSACEAEQMPKTVDATGRVLQAAQETAIADVNLRTAVVQATPLAMYAEAIIRTGSPQSIAAAAEMAGCRAANTTGDSARSGCAKEVPDAWRKAVDDLAACPTCPTCPPSTPTPP